MKFATTNSRERSSARRICCRNAGVDDVGALDMPVADMLVCVVDVFELESSPLVNATA